VKKQAGTRIGTFLTVPEETRQALEARTLEIPPRQAEALAILCRSDEPLTVSDLCRLAKCAPGPIAALRQRGHVHTVKRRLRKPADAPQPDGDGDAGAKGAPTPTAEQEAALARLAPALEADAFATFL